MNEDEFNKLKKFFEINDIILKTNDYCHECNSYKEEDLDIDGWLKERLVDEQALEE